MEGDKPAEASEAQGSGAAGQATEQADILPSKRLKKPVKPDVEEHKGLVDGLQDELNRRRERSEALKHLIEQKKSSGGSPETQKAKNKLQELSSSFRAELEKKNGMREELKALNGSRDALRGQLRDLKTKLGPYVTVQKIDERLSALEHRLSHTTVDLKDELRAREEMKKTAALKSLASQHTTSQEKLKASDKQREDLLNQMKGLDDKINAIKSQEEKQKDVFAELRKKDSAKTQDVPALIKEKDECREVMNALYQKIKELKAEFKERNNEFWQESQAWREQQKEERKERDAQREKDYQARQAERQAAAREFAGEPYHKEVGLCDQLISHLAKFVPQTQPTGPTTTASAKETGDSQKQFEGMKAVPKGKKEDDEFGAFMGSSAKKGKGKKAKQGGCDKQPPAQKLNHSLDIIDAFDTLKVSVPSSSGQVPAALEEVEKSKQYWLKKRVEAKESGIMPPQESKPVANGLPKQQKSPKLQAPSSFNLEDFPEIRGHYNEQLRDYIAEETQKRDKLVEVEIKFLYDRIRMYLNVIPIKAPMSDS